MNRELSSIFRKELAETMEEHQANIYINGVKCTHRLSPLILPEKVDQILLSSSKANFYQDGDIDIDPLKEGNRGVVLTTEDQNLLIAFIKTCRATISMVGLVEELTEQDNDNK